MLKRRHSYVSQLDVIYITLDMSTPSTAGFLLSFSSGSIYIDFKDGGGLQTVTSDILIQNTYTTPGTYIVEISGMGLTKITKFLAPSSKITAITGLKTGLLTDLNLGDNLFIPLSLSDATISGSVALSENSNLQSITFASSGNEQVTSFNINNCDVLALDLTNVPIASVFRASNNTNFISLTLSSAGNGQVTLFDLGNCNLSSLDLTNVPIGTLFNIDNNNNLSSLIFATSGNSTVSNFRVFNCNLSSLDLSNVPISTLFQCNGNASLDTLTFAASGNGSFVNFHAYDCNLPNIDFSVFATSNACNILLDGNSFTATEHDNQLINLDATGWINSNLDILTGNTARTAASDTAYNNLIAKGWTIT